MAALHPRSRLSAWLARRRDQRRLRRLQDDYYRFRRDESEVIPEYIATLASLRRADNAAHLREKRPRRALHLGSGGHNMDGWINADLAFDSAMSLCMDASRGLPFRDASVHRIFSEDFFEHLELRDAVEVLRECHRILHPEGSMRIGLPDLHAIVIRTYLGRNEADLRWCREKFGDETPCEALNRHMRMDGEHRFLYDWEFLSKLLEREGFSAKRQDFHVTDYPEYRFVDMRGYGLSLYVEARPKPR